MLWVVVLIGVGVGIAGVLVYLFLAEVDDDRF